MSKELENLLIKLVEPHYNEPHRAYHNMKHIESGLTLLDQLERQNYIITDNQKAAWIFHDVVYQPNNYYNEAKSADLFCEYNKTYRLGFSEDDVKEIVMIILDTKSHVPSISASKLILDIDMFIFASPYTQFVEYREQIKQELGKDFTEEQFKVGTKAFLNYYLKQPDQIFSTRYFKDFTDKAVGNLTMYIEKEL